MEQCLRDESWAFNSARSAGSFSRRGTARVRGGARSGPTSFHLTGVYVNPHRPPHGTSAENLGGEPRLDRPAFSASWYREPISAPPQSSARAASLRGARFRPKSLYDIGRGPRSSSVTEWEGPTWHSAGELAASLGSRARLLGFGRSDKPPIDYASGVCRVLIDSSDRRCKSGLPRALTRRMDRRDVRLRFPERIQKIVMNERGHHVAAPQVR